MDQYTLFLIESPDLPRMSRLKNRKSNLIMNAHWAKDPVLKAKWSLQAAMLEFVVVLIEIQEGNYQDALDNLGSMGNSLVKFVEYAKEVNNSRGE